MLIFLKRIIKLGWQNFCREKETIFPTIFVLFIPVFLTGFSLLLKDTGNYLIDVVKTKADVSVYFKENIKEEEILKIKEELLKNPLVKSVEYISTEEALEEFKERYKENPVYMESLEMVGKNPFLASLNISVHDASGYGVINHFFEREEIQKLVDHTSYPKSKIILEQIFSFISFSKKIGIALWAIFLIVAILINFNTIKLAILNSKLEIENQRMVGASNWFIRGPFLVQSLISGFLVGILSFLILGLICWVFAPKLEAFLAGLNLFRLLKENFLKLLVIHFSMAIGLAVISTYWATRRYLTI